MGRDPHPRPSPLGPSAWQLATRRGRAFPCFVLNICTQSSSVDASSYSTCTQRHTRAHSQKEICICVCLCAYIATNGPDKSTALKYLRWHNFVCGWRAPSAWEAQRGALWTEQQTTGSRFVCASQCVKDNYNMCAHTYTYTLDLHG